MLIAKVTAGVVLAATLVLAPAPAAGTASVGSSRWRWPTVPASAVVQPFIAPASPYTAGHRGVDLAAASGQVVFAPTTSVVQFGGTVVDRPVLTLRVGDHVLVSFEPVTAEQPAGTSVIAGQPVGVVAHGGHCDARCLHVGVRVDGDYVSPMVFFAGIPPAVLLPLPLQ